MTTETTDATKKKGSKPTHEIFEVGADGKPNYKARSGAWAHGKGGGANFTIGGKRYVMFPVKPKAEQSSEQPATTDEAGA